MNLQRNDLALLTGDWFNGFGAIVARQHELATTALVDMTEVLRCCRPGGDPRQAIARQAEFARKVMATAVANTRDLAGLAEKSGAGAFSAAQEHVQSAVADWLSDPVNSAKLAGFVMDKLPAAVDAIDRSGLPAIVSVHVRTELERVEAAPLAAGLLNGMVEHGRSQQLLDALLDGLEELVSNRSAMEAVRQRFRSQLPALFNLYQGEPVVMNRIIDSIMASIAEIRGDRSHPLRVELNTYLASFALRLQDSPELAGQLDALKHDLLERAELTDLASGVWERLRDFLVQDAHAEHSKIRRQLEALLVEASGRLKAGSLVSRGESGKESVLTASAVKSVPE